MSWNNKVRLEYKNVMLEASCGLIFQPLEEGGDKILSE
jgi:hypothetical protein